VGKSGRSLMRTAVDAGIDGIAADCGGCLTCATCHVIVDAAWAEKLSPPTDDELAMLEMTAAPRRPTSRLSCQLVLSAELDGLVVQLPATQY
jgi:2Fe-2S ferredoxin